MSGRTIGQIAKEIKLKVPSDQNSNKGWVGQLAELYLGASAANLPEPDFQALGVELKTLPMTKPGVPKESTYICTVNLTETSGIRWVNSTVKKKISRILWLPVEADGSIPLGQRRFGNPLIWSPDFQQEEILKNDWEEIMELISMGELDKISSAMGTYLQIRPKAANADALETIDVNPFIVLPEGEGALAVDALIAVRNIAGE